MTDAVLKGYLVAATDITARVAGGVKGWRQVGPRMWVRPDFVTVEYLSVLDLLTSPQNPGVIYVVDDHLDVVARAELEARGHQVEDIRMSLGRRSKRAGEPTD
jgi:hypothetical protein